MPAQPSAAWLDMLADVVLDSVPATISLTATSTTGSPDLTAVGTATGVAIGAVVTAPSAAIGKTVIAIDNAAHTMTLSGNAGVTATGTWTFTPPSLPIPLEVGLFTGSPSLTVATVMADLDQPTYAGYVVQAVTIQPRRGDAAGDVIIPLGTSTWQPTGAVIPEQVITGFFVRQPGSDTLLFSELIATPWVAQSALSALDVIDEIYIPADAVYGGICTTCSPT